MLASSRGVDAQVASQRNSQVVNLSEAHSCRPALTTRKNVSLRQVLGLRGVVGPDRAQHEFIDALAMALKQDPKARTSPDRKRNISDSLASVYTKDLKIHEAV